MIQVRPSEERGHNKLAWLDTRFSFSFDQYFDPEHMNFRSLRVMNEDHIAPAKGFGLHPHRDMEILTWVLSGSLEHRDSTGGHGVLRPGELQHMSAGTGVMHSEFNASPKEEVHLLQIWILPDRNGRKPEYEQIAFSESELRNQFHHVAGRQAPVSIHQAADLYIARLDAGAKVSRPLVSGRHAWLQVARGSVILNGTALHAGDGAAISSETEIRVEAKEASEVLLFDLA